MDSRDQVDLEARLAAIEQLLAMLYANGLSPRSDPVEALETMEANLLAGLDRPMVGSGLSPEVVGLTAGQVGDHLQRLVALIRALLETSSFRGQ